MDLNAFLAENAVKVENTKYAASDRFIGDNGNPALWEIRALSGAEDDALRRDCQARVPVPGKRGQYTEELDVNKYMAKLAVAATAAPNLNDSNLQDSYHVMGAEDLLKAMLTAGEYTCYVAKVQEVCGFDRAFMEDVETAKN